MLLNGIYLIVGFLLIAWAADRFVVGAANIARALRVSPLMIGLTIVALGTSAPEMFVSVSAALQGKPELAVGNVLGSNIANIGLVLGVAALVAPMQVESRILRREYPILFFIMLAAWGLMLDGELSRWDSVLLLSGLVVLLVGFIVLAYQSRVDGAMASEYQQVIQQATLPMSIALVWFVVGLVLLPVSARLIVYAAVEIASGFGVSELIIGLTIVAVGTSLPEVAASIVAALKKEHDIAIGNILGSNMVNLLAVLAVPGIIHAIPVTANVLTRDVPVMFGMTAVLFIVAYGFRGPGRITRWEGAILLLGYMAYIAWVIAG